MRLVPTVDAFASNIRPQALARLGLDYEQVKQRNASIVYLSMVGYGSDGRYAGRPAYDDLIQAASGIPMLLQRSTGQPRFIPMAAIDRIVGSAAANALLAGLLARARTGIGQRIEVPMFETMAQFVLAEHMQGATFDPPTGPAGYARTLSQHRRPYQTKDGFIAVLPYNDGQWRRFFEAIGKAHVVESDQAFRRHRRPHGEHRCAVRDARRRTEAPHDRRVARSAAAERHSVHPSAYAGEPAGRPSFGRCRILPVRGASVRRPHPHHARAQHLVGNRAAHRPLRPRLGQHTREILAEAGYTPNEIDALLAQRAVMTDGERG